MKLCGYCESCFDSKKGHTHTCKYFVSPSTCGLEMIEVNTYFTQNEYRKIMNGEKKK